MDGKNHYIYLVHPKSSWDSKRPEANNIYKIGKTTQEKLDRIKSYESGTILIIMVKVDDCHIAEKELLKIFEREFKKEPGGKEYFRGDVYKMKKIIFEYSGPGANTETPRSTSSGCSAIWKLRMFTDIRDLVWNSESRSGFVVKKSNPIWTEYDDISELCDDMLIPEYRDMDFNVIHGDGKLFENFKKIVMERKNHDFIANGTTYRKVSDLADEEMISCPRPRWYVDKLIGEIASDPTNKSIISKLDAWSETNIWFGDDDEGYTMIDTSTGVCKLIELKRKHYVSMSPGWKINKISHSPSEEDIDSMNKIIMSFIPDKRDRIAFAVFCNDVLCYKGRVISVNEGSIYGDYVGMFSDIIDAMIGNTHGIRVWNRCYDDDKVEWLCRCNEEADNHIVKNCSAIVHQSRYKFNNVTYCTLGLFEHMNISCIDIDGSNVSLSKLRAVFYDKHHIFRLWCGSMTSKFGVKVIDKDYTEKLLDTIDFDDVQFTPPE